MIDLRSDTLTQPTQGMRRAMAEAVVGDEQKREDPTVISLEERGAELLGQEEAVYVPTATMANQIALRVLSEPGDEVIAEALAHVFRYELGGPAVHSGLAMKALHTEDGRFTPEQLREAVSPRGDLHVAPTRVVCVENTHNGGGGRVWSLQQVREIVTEARRHELAAHLDGARLMNAAVASGSSAAEYGQEFDTVTLCFSKGLGCPLGALVAGSRERMAKGRRMKHL
ncbi:MAG: threonine aldolase family protein, partial [Candidatus Limnocylindria bacterium]